MFKTYWEIQKINEIMAQTLPNCKSPCLDCPFRKDTIFRLGKERSESILASESFVCHKTTHMAIKNRLQCAGFMHIKPNNEFQRLANERMFDTGLKNRELVFDIQQNFIDYHTENY